MYSATASSIGRYPTLDAGKAHRLGKLVEQFVLFELNEDESVELLSSNVQVFLNRITIGELDVLIIQGTQPIHLEIVYKFYLYDPSIPEELNRWVGPNKKDSLVLKLSKLITKQLPLLYHPKTIESLAELGVQPNDWLQRVYFKAQLFVPFDSPTTGYPLINNDCIKGFYLNPDDLSSFPTHRFYIPSKLDWLIDPHPGVGWITFPDFQSAIQEILDAKKSPLCWMRSSDGIMQKFFVVWW